MDYKCPSMIYGTKSDTAPNITIKKIISTHNHPLSTEQEVLAYKENSRKFIQQETKDLAFELFKQGESARDIFNLIKNEYKIKKKTSILHSLH